MKKKKIQLKKLQVNSFITSLTNDEAKEIRGGALVRPQNNNGMLSPNLGRKIMWTISEQRKDAVRFGKKSDGGRYFEK